MKTGIFFYLLTVLFLVHAKPVHAAGEFAEQYRLCMLCKNAGGQFKAGLVNKVNNKNFFLLAGETDSGVYLVEVRLEEGVAVLRQGDETVELILEGLALSGAPRSSTVIIASPSVETAPVQSICRAGTDVAPEHILAALTDSLPKQPRLTVRKIKPIPSGNSSDFDETSTARVLPSGSYLVQSVPKRYSPF